MNPADHIPFSSMAQSLPVNDSTAPQPLSTQARLARHAFSQWYLGKHSEEELDAMRRKGTWGSESRQSRETFDQLGEDIVHIWDRYQSMADYERQVVSELRDRDVSIPDLIDYIRAEPGLNAENKPVRADIAATLRKREFLAKSKRIEASGRSAAIIAGAVSMVAIGAWVATSGLVPGLEVAANTLAPWIPKATQTAMGLLKSAAGGGAIIIAWKAWKEYNEAKSGAGPLNIGQARDFADLPNSLGAQNYAELNDEYESIPGSDRHLIKHLSPTELRMFLSGSDSTRLHILRTNPPSPWAKVQMRIEKTSSDQDSWIKQLSKAAWAVLSSPWHREKNNARIPDLDAKLDTWRTFSRLNREHREIHLEAGTRQGAKPRSGG